MKRPNCDHAPELCCVKCADWWSAELAALPPKAPPVIKDARHAHTARMRLGNMAKLLEDDPSLLGALVPPEAHGYVVSELYRAAAEIENG